MDEKEIFWVCRGWHALTLKKPCTKNKNRTTKRIIVLDLHFDTVLSALFRLNCLNEKSYSLAK